MHASRIAALEARLVILDQKEADGLSMPSAIALDRFNTQEELGYLRGIALRNTALAAQAPAIEATKTVSRERRRRLRERAQLTPGSTI